MAQTPKKTITNWKTGRDVKVNNLDRNLEAEEAAVEAAEKEAKKAPAKKAADK